MIGKVYHQRLDYFDSGRGFAALSVMIWHFLVMFIHREDTTLIKNPLHIFYYGEANVIFFFIHSGYILSYSYEHKLRYLHWVAYLQFIIERLFRIFPLFLFVLLTSFFAQKSAFNFYEYSYLSGHTKQLWGNPAEIKDLIQQAILIIRPTAQEIKRLMPQDWTLSVELIACFCLPLLIAVFNKSKIVFIILFIVLWQYYNTYVFEFGLGLLLFQYKDKFIKRWVTTSIYLKYLLLLAAIVFYTCFFKFGSLFSTENIIVSSSVDRLIVNVGCVFVFIILTCSFRLQNTLSVTWLVSIGKICYSLYLWHMLWLILFASSIYAYLQTFFVASKFIYLTIELILYFVSTILVSYFSYHLIETPFNKMGKKLSAKILKPSKSYTGIINSINNPVT